jgi:hypothetical protein
MFLYARNCMTRLFIRTAQNCPGHNYNNYVVKNKEKDECRS